MKTPATATLAACLLFSSLLPTRAQNPPDRPADEAHFSEIARDASSATLQKITYDQGPDGQWTPRVHRILKLATGLHYQSQPDGPWLDSVPQLSLVADGAAATQGQTALSLPGDLYSGAISLSGPDGTVMTCRPALLAYSDGQRSALIAELQPGSSGLLLPSTASGAPVLYTNIATDLRLDLLVTYKLSGVCSDLLIREPLPDPAEFGLTNSNGTTEPNVRLQWWTEFFGTADPAIKPMPGPAANALADSILRFGSSMQMVPGAAFFVTSDTDSLPTNPNSRRDGAHVYKSWVTVAGAPGQPARKFLVEEVPLSTLASQLQRLGGQLQGKADHPLQNGVVVAASRSAAASPFSARPVQAKRGEGRDQASSLPLARLLPPMRAVQRSTRPIHLAAATLPLGPAVSLDWEEVSGTVGSYTFQADTTYEVTNGFYVHSLTAEGDTVVKLGGTITVDADGTINCQSGPYRPIVITSKNDDSYGEGLDDSSGTPAAGDYSLGLRVPASGAVLRNIRVCYADQAVSGGYGTAGFDVWDSQFLEDLKALGGGASIGAHNVLIQTPGNDDWGFVIAVEGGFTGEHMTMDGSCSAIFGNTGGGTVNIAMINSLITGVGSNNFCLGSASVSTNSVAWLLTPDGVYQTVGGGAYYLADGTYRQTGTTNISPALLADLSRCTTYPPLVYSNTTISSVTTLYPQVQRNFGSQLDIGYSYPALDYCFGGVTAATNITCAAGAAIGLFVPPNGNPAIALTGLATLTFNGTEQSPCWAARANTVQETINGTWPPNWAPACITGSGGPYITNASHIKARFTGFSVINNEIQDYQDVSGRLVCDAVNCQFYSGYLGWYNPCHHLTNCVLERSFVGLFAHWPDSSVFMRNCTMHGGTLYLDRQTDATNAVVSVRDCAFDATSIDVTTHPGAPAATDFAYNAFLTNSSRLYPTNANDLLVTNFNWQAGPLGLWYLPTNSPLIDAGSLTNAGLAGLYHFTTQTSQVKDGMTRLDISYHYVAADGNGNPIDTDSDGTPDYLEDANGNGKVDSGETDWQSAADLGLRVVITRPANNSIIP